MQIDFILHRVDNIPACSIPETLFVGIIQTTVTGIIPITYVLKLSLKLHSSFQQRAKFGLLI